jgi:hypothetical protein
MKNANASFSYVEVPPYAASVTAPVVCPLWGHKRTHAPQQTVYLLDHFIGWSDARKILKVIPAQLPSFRHGLRKCHRSRELPRGNFLKSRPLPAQVENQRYRHRNTQERQDMLQSARFGSLI